jgi:hypothetical protein
MTAASRSNPPPVSCDLALPVAADPARAGGLQGLREASLLPRPFRLHRRPQGGLVELPRVGDRDADQGGLDDVRLPPRGEGRGLRGDGRGEGAGRLPDPDLRQR